MGLYEAWRVCLRVHVPGHKDLLSSVSAHLVASVGCSVVIVTYQGLASSMDAQASAGGGRDLILTVFPLTSGGTKPSPRCGHSLTAVEHELFLFGGADDQGIVGDFYKCAIGT